VLHRMRSLVLVKPARGSIEPVILAQLMEHIVDVTEDSGNRKRKRKHRSRYTKPIPLFASSVCPM
jgi:sulfite reductase beta subunit-like hemoprotein